MGHPEDEHLKDTSGLGDSYKTPEYFKAPGD